MALDPSIKIRQMLAGDIPAACELCRLAGWNQVTDDWQIFLNTQAAGCIVAVCGERVVGTATAANYENSVGWIGMVLVDPQMRRKGIATALMQQAIEILSPCECVKLDATDAGRNVYIKLGFSDEYRIDRYGTEKLTCKFNNIQPEQPRKIIQLGTKLPMESLELDADIFGASRAPLLKEIARHNPDYCIASLNSRGKITGFALARSGHNYTQIGPIIADNPDSANLLIQAMLNKFNSRAVCIDVNEYQAEIAKILQNSNMSCQRSFTRMYRGQNSRPGIPRKQIAICGPEHS